MVDSARHPDELAGLVHICVGVELNVRRLSSPTSRPQDGHRNRSFLKLPHPHAGSVVLSRQPYESPWVCIMKNAGSGNMKPIHLPPPAKQRQRRLTVFGAAKQCPIGQDMNQKTG